MPRPVIALLTDFGLHDHYVGVMKGVMLGICPDATFVDISHDIPPQDVMGGALELGAAFRYFPPATVFLVVVDPGVGSDRRAVAAEAGGRRFVAPDNGVLSMVFELDPPSLVVELAAREFQRPEVSRTFEGRDRFAPAAAWLASGVSMARLGPQVDLVGRLDIPKPTFTPAAIEGQILRVDRFGNLITNIDRASFAAMTKGGAVSIGVGGRDISTVVETYAEAPPGQLCALFSSTDRLEVAVNGSSAARELGISRGAAVSVRRIPS